jgi:hypothetical protein
MRCPRCEKPFDDDDLPAACEICGAELPRRREPARRAPIRADLVKIYEPRTEGDLALVRAILSSAGIASFALGEHIRLTRPCFDTPLAIAVAADEAERALEALRRQGVVPAAVEGSDLDRFWLGPVAAALAAPHVGALAAEIGSCEASFRASIFARLEAAGPRGIALLEDLVLALGHRGPSAAAREAAAYVAASEALRDRRPALAAALGALIGASSPVEVALRVASMLERFRGSTEAERAIVPLLDHADAAVRDAAIEALYSISGGETLGFEPDASADQRGAAVARWRARVGGRP